MRRPALSSGKEQLSVLKQPAVPVPCPELVAPIEGIRDILATELAGVVELLDGAAEALPLPWNSDDGIVAGQAFRAISRPHCRSSTEGWFEEAVSVCSERPGDESVDWLYLPQ